MSRDQEWVAEERRLWGVMMYATYNVASTKRNTKILAAAKRQGKHLKRVQEQHQMIEEDQAAARSWRAYQNWARH
jgi:hypothetical protein